MAELTLKNNNQVKQIISQEQRETHRDLVRKYIHFDEKSAEGLAIANQVYRNTGYQLGPLTKEIPKFGNDVKYRKEKVETLKKFLHRMNQEWKESDLQREIHTTTKSSRTTRGIYEYKDTVTGANVSSHVYENRYLQYVKAHEINPVLHFYYSSQEKATQGNEITESAPSTIVLESNENAELLFMTTLGINISQSSIIGNDFFSSETKHATSNAQIYRGEDLAFRAAVDSNRETLWHNWSTTFDRGSRNCTVQSEKDHSEDISGPSATRKRARERRRSLVVPNLDDFQATINASVAHSPDDANNTPSSIGESHQYRLKRSRSASHTSGKSLKSRRKSRCLSIASHVDLASVVTSEADEKTAAKNCKAMQSLCKSLPVRHPANGYVRKASLLETMEDEISDVS